MHSEELVRSSTSMNSFSEKKLDTEDVGSTFRKDSIEGGVGRERVEELETDLLIDNEFQFINRVCCYFSKRLITLSCGQ